MTKSLQEIQQENRRLILEAIHGCSYEEALEKDEKYLLSNSFFSNGLCLIKEYIRPENFYKELGQPITLSRVLLALNQTKKVFLYFDIYEPAICERAPDVYDYDNFNILSNWNLTKETLEKQTEETQRNINQFLKQ
jgi:hypothetical protein